MPAKEGFAGHAGHEIEVDAAGHVAAHETDERQASRSFVQQHTECRRTDDILRTLTSRVRKKRCLSPGDYVDG